MIECLILGDSIAVGVHKYRNECTVYAKSGINSTNYNKRYLQRNLNADTVVISLGSNAKGIDTKDNLEKLRKEVTAKKVFWVLPANNEEARYIIEAIANEYGDTYIRIPRTADRVHPTTSSYKRIAEITKYY